VPLRVLDLADVPGLRGRLGADLVLVRPDQHVAWRGDTVPDAEAVLAVVTGRRQSTAAGCGQV
jgi:hypothetical protein